MVNGTNSTAGPPHQRDDFIYMLSVIEPPFTLMFGTFGNVMTILVVRMAGRNLCGPSMSVFFVTSAVLDQTVLTMGLGRKWFRPLAFDIRTIHGLVCKVHKFIVNCGTRNTAWITVAMTTQRVSAVLWPVRHKVYATRKTALIVVLVIAIFCALVDLEILFKYDLVVKNHGEVKCMPVLKSPSEVFHYYTVFSSINIVTVYLLPSVLLLVNNVILTTKLHRSPSTIQSSSSTLRKNAASITAMSIAISWSFMLLHISIPINVFRNMLKKPELTKLTDTILDIILYWCYATNFFLYMFCSPVFRRQTRKMLCGEPLSSRTSTGAASPITDLHLQDRSRTIPKGTAIESLPSKTNDIPASPVTDLHSQSGSETIHTGRTIELERNHADFCSVVHITPATGECSACSGSGNCYPSPIIY